MPVASKPALRMNFALCPDCRQEHPRRRSKTGNIARDLASRRMNSSVARGVPSGPATSRNHLLPSVFSLQADRLFLRVGAVPRSGLPLMLRASLSAPGSPLRILASHLLLPWAQAGLPSRQAWAPPQSRQRQTHQQAAESLHQGLSQVSATLISAALQVLVELQARRDLPPHRS